VRTSGQSAASAVEEEINMGGLSWWHWMIIIAAFVILFGYKRLPDAARGVGRSLRILKSEVSAMQDDDKANRPAETDATAAVPTPAPQITPSPVVPVTPPPTPPVTTTSVPVEERKA
jgi:sec-independent protein translocase protein TatA